MDGSYYRQLGESIVVVSKLQGCLFGFLGALLALAAVGLAWYGYQHVGVTFH